MPSVFLSYDHDDAERAAQIASALEKAGHSVWWDRHIKGGAEFNDEIEAAVKEADVVVVLWSKWSVRSAWVRDEAAEGRDQGKLVPVLIDTIKPPMGFRQFQTIDLPGWKGRKPPPQIPELLHAVERIAGGTGASTTTTPALPPIVSRIPRSWLIVAGAMALTLMLGAGIWTWIGRGTLPVVEVAASDASPKSQAAASDLYVKLGSLAQVGKGKWQLVDAAAAPSRPDLVFRTANTGTPGQPQAHLVLLDGNDDALLWSREFSFSSGREADLRQQLALTAGRILNCALEGRDASLRRDVLKLYLSACSFLAEISGDEPKKALGVLRSIVAAEPSFKPAWARLISADMSVVDFDRLSGGDPANAIRTLRADMAKARKVAPELPELPLAATTLLPATAYEQKLQLMGNAASRGPDNAQIFADQAQALMSVGRMSDALMSARRAAELDPLSPAATTQLIMVLAHGGQTEVARQELARAERLWAGTGALRHVLWSFNLRYGDPALARKYAGFSDPGLDLYLDTRANPTPANVRKIVALDRQYESQPKFYRFIIMDFAEFNQIDDAFRVIAKAPTEMLAKDSYMWFRPAYAGLRRDPRFMQFAKRIGLVDYWRTSGNWPDFCNEPDLPYNCKAEAAKLGA